MTDKPLVFVSCGQFTEGERQLGKDICGLLGQLRPDVEPYFAQNQSTVDGLSDHIFKALYRAAGFVCVIHKRGNILQPDGNSITRGSVWIEQEISIAAFLGHVLQRPITTLFYKQKGISFEGVRSVLLMNARLEFESEHQILDDLRVALPTSSFTPFRAYDLQPTLEHKLDRKNSHGDRHVYIMTCGVQNTGSQPVTDFKLRIRFPRLFLPSNTTWMLENHHISTPSHVCFEIDGSRAPGGLYATEKLQQP
jgi:hypothetical protein